MSNFASIYGPLDKSACVYFLITTIIFFFILVIVFFSELFFVFKNYNKLNRMTFVNGIVILFNIFLAYFVNRLLYNMCSKSLA